MIGCWTRYFLDQKKELAFAFCFTISVLLIVFPIEFWCSAFYLSWGCTILEEICLYCKLCKPITWPSLCKCRTRYGFIVIEAVIDFHCSSSFSIDYILVFWLKLRQRVSLTKAYSNSLLFGFGYSLRMKGSLSHSQIQ